MALVLFFCFLMLISFLAGFFLRQLKQFLHFRRLLKKANEVWDMYSQFDSFDSYVQNLPSSDRDFILEKYFD